MKVTALPEGKYDLVLKGLGRDGVDRLKAAARERGITPRQYVEQLERERVQRQISRAIWIDLRALPEVRR